jgi:riboflavin kinase/FMN adenylyltransferase
MELLRELKTSTLEKPSVLTIGVFDGVHLGHQYLVGKLIDSSRRTNRLAGVVTFDCHPDEVLAPDRDIRYLTSPDEKLELLARLGLDFVVNLPFTRDLAQTTAREFISDLVDGVQMRELWIGPDFALGRGRKGDAKYLESLAHEMGFRLHRLQPFMRSGRVISSSRIRRLVRQGAVSEAADLLGRYPSVSGIVVPGARRGHKLGFPTANLNLDRRLIIPATGVYAARVQWDNVNHEGVVSIGTRPTFEDRSEPILEAYIFEFAGDLYGESLHVEFIERLRPELRFDSAEALVVQMNKDKEDARRILEQSQPA